MPGEQIGLRSQQLDRADDQAVNSRLLVRRQKMRVSQRCFGELVQLTVDDISVSVFLHFYRAV